MASKASIAIRRDVAIEKCQAAIRAIWGEEFNLPRRHRDITMLSAIQMETIAEYLDCKAQEISIKPVVSVPLELEIQGTAKRKAKA